MAKTTALRALLTAVLIVGLTGTALAGTTINLAGSNITSKNGVNNITTMDGNHIWTIELQNGAIINWGKLGLDNGEILNFNFATTNGAVLNRITGTDATHIAGTINSNGKVFLVNPNGILFTSGAAINTQLFTASAPNVTDAAFTSYATNQSSSLLFAGAGVIVVNDTIAMDCPNVSLIASYVSLAPGVTFSPDVKQVSAGPGTVTYSNNSLTVNAAANPIVIYDSGTNGGTIVDSTRSISVMPTLIIDLSSTPLGTTFGAATPGTNTGGSPANSGGIEILPGSGGGLVSVLLPPPAGSSGVTPAGASGSEPPSPPAGIAPGGQAAGGTASGSSGVTPLVDASDRALAVVAAPTPVAPASNSQPLPPMTAILLPGVVDQQLAPPPRGGVPGVANSFSSAGSSGSW